MTRDGDELILSVRDLTCSFSGSGGTGWRTNPPVQALRGVSFDLHSGECLALVGESGSGKTTLVRCILRLLEPSSGSVFYSGEDVLAMDRGRLQGLRKKAQIVFQDPQASLNPRMRAGAMLEEVLAVHGQDTPPEDRRRQVADLLEMVGLHASHADRYPHELSGGQRQRLGIARALSVAPRLLVLDEPVSSLDLSAQAQILNLLGGLQERLSLTMILVAHDLAVVRQIADRVAVMYLGRIVEVASTDRLFRGPVHPYTRGLMELAASGRQWEGPEKLGMVEGGGEGTGLRSWRILAGEIPDPTRPPAGCGFHPRCPHPKKDGICTSRVPELKSAPGGGQAACWKET